MRVIAAVLIAIAAFGLQRAATLPWASAAGPAGTRYRISPIGIGFSGADGRTIRDCRWWPKLGDASLCAVTPGGEAHFRRLRAVYPLLSAAWWIAVIGLFLQVLRLPRPPAVRAVVAWLAAGLAFIAVAIMVASMPRALAAVAGERLGYSMVGFLLGSLAAVFALVSGALVLLRRRPAAP